VASAPSRDPGALVLGIETSCDETAAAVVADGHEILSNVVSSQVADHAPFGGVVPELASRRHLEAIVWVVQQALEQAGKDLNEITGIAVTQGPGLIGALLVGLGLAKALAWARALAIVGINHLEAHLAALRWAEPRAVYPMVALLVSGGHTCLYYIPAQGQMELVGQSVDDAAGEAFDKVAKLFGLGYPGGVRISRLGAGGNPQAYDFPRPMISSGDYNFSFAGLKSALVRFREAHKGQPYRLEDVCASFEQAVVDVLVAKTMAAAQHFGAKAVGAAGGVAANARLRAELGRAAKARGLSLSLAPVELCTDNAAMVAALGSDKLRAGERLGLEAEAVSRVDSSGGLG